MITSEGDKFAAFIHKIFEFQWLPVGLNTIYILGNLHCEIFLSVIHFYVGRSSIFTNQPQSNGKLIFKSWLS